MIRFGKMKHDVGRAGQPGYVLKKGERVRLTSADNLPDTGKWYGSKADSEPDSILLDGTEFEFEPRVELTDRERLVLALALGYAAIELNDLNRFYKVNDGIKPGEGVVESQYLDMTGSFVSIEEIRAIRSKLI